MEIPANAFTTTIQVRVNDTDMFGHMNNARYVSLLEAARMDWSRALQERYDRTRLRAIMAHVEVNYLRAITLEHEVACTFWVSKIGTKSYTMSYVIHPHDQLEMAFATAKTVLVTFDFNDHQSIPIPEWYLIILREFYSEMDI